MDNNMIPIAPGQETAMLPEPASSRELRRSNVDQEGREKRFVFVRRMNSAAAALFADILISSLLMLAVAIPLISILGVYTVFDSLFDLLLAFEDVSTVDFDDALTLIMMIATAIGSAGGHMIPAYMHGVRNGFSAPGTFRRGSKLGLTLPAAIITAFGFTYIWVFVFAICGQLMPDSFFAQSDVFGSSYAGMDLASIIVSGVTTSLIVPIAEEFLFRGAILKSLSKYGIPFAVGASAVLFGLMHGNIFQAPFATVAGIIMGYVAIRSGSLWPSIIIHMAINSFSTVCDMLIALLPERYTLMVQFIFYGFTGLCILGTVIILCTCGKRIKWEPIDRATNHILLPEVETKVRCKPLLFVLSIGIIIFILVFGCMILADCGIDFGMGDYLDSIATSLE